MLFRLVQVIEDHGEEICAHVLGQVRQSAYLAHIRMLPVSEIRDWLMDIAPHLGQRFQAREIAELRSRMFGRLCFQESIPLREAVHLLHRLKNRMTDFVRDQGIEQNALELYAERELDRWVDRLFERVIYQLVCGYEEALLDATRRMPTVCRLPLPSADAGELETAA